MVKIELEDVNDNVPVFSPSVYNMTLRTGQPVGQTFLVLRATDLDSGTFGRVEYSIRSGNSRGTFQLDRETGELSLYSALAQSPAFHRLEVEARDGAGRQTDLPAIVNINVLDQNYLATAPLFDSSIYQFTVREDASKFSAVGKVLPQNLNIGRVFIYPEEMKKYFDINPTTGTISTRHSLDHEEHNTFLLNIGAIRSDAPLMGYCQVSIKVEDVNDNKPQFGPTLGTVSIPENSPTNTIVYANRARDRDSGDNGVVKYRLVRDDKNYFNIDEDSGVLTTNKVRGLFMWALIRMISTSNAHNGVVQVPLVYQNAFMLLLSIIYYISLLVSRLASFRPIFIIMYLSISLFIFN